MVGPPRVSALELIEHNILSPIVLAFALGVVATLAKSDLRIPEEIYSALSIYLLFAIGLKGGAELAHTPLSQFLFPALGAVVLGVMIPVWVYLCCRKVGRMSVADAAAMAAHYGSVSAVTFIACMNFLDFQEIRYEGFMPAVVAVLEIPSIIVALGLARFFGGAGSGWGHALHEIVTGKSILLLMGGVAIGYAAGPEGYEQVAPFFQRPFKGILCLFLLEMGMVAAGRMGDLKKAGLFLILFGILAPLLDGVLGVGAGKLAGLSLGGCTILGVLCASASYIAATAAVRASLPQANPSYYLTSALAITFPFNLTFGIPIYLAAARWIGAT